MTNATIPTGDAVRRRRARAAALVCVAGGLACSIGLSLRSDGVYHDDDLTHLQFARWSWSHPAYLLNDWGRPGFTVLYAAPAALGWTAARLFSGLLTAAAAWIAFRVAEHQRWRLAWVTPALLWLQPEVMALSATTLTETALMFYLTAAVWLYLRGRQAAAAGVFSLALVTRHEAMALLPLWWFALLRGRRPLREWALLLWAPATHNVLGWIFLGRLPASMFVEPRPTDYYGHGPWLAMAARWLVASGGGILTLAAAGGWWALRRRGGLLWMGSAAVYFLAHTLIFRFGLFASGGYSRFLVPIAPMAATAAAASLSSVWVYCRGPRDASRRHVRVVLLSIGAAAAGWWFAADSIYPGWLWWGLRWPSVGLAWVGAGALFRLGRRASAWTAAGRRPPRVAALVGAAPAWLSPAWLVCCALGHAWHEYRPLRLQEDQLLIREATDHLRAAGLDRREIVTVNGWVTEFLGRVNAPAQPLLRERLARMRSGDLFVWDARYCRQPPSPISAEEARAAPELVELWHGSAHSRDGVYAIVFERR